MNVSGRSLFNFFGTVTGSGGGGSSGTSLGRDFFSSSCFFGGGSKDTAGGGKGLRIGFGSAGFGGSVLEAGGSARPPSSQAVSL